MNLVLILILSTSPLLCLASVELFQEALCYATVRITTFCETLPSHVQNAVTFLKTDSCIVLYSKEDCVGSSYLVEAGSHLFLPDFKNMAKSYRACTNPSRDVRIMLYLDDSKDYSVWEKQIRSNCTTLPETIRNRVLSVQPDICVFLFSEKNCVGRRLVVREAHSKISLEYYEYHLESFMPCNASEASDTLMFMEATTKSPLLHSPTTTATADTNTKSQMPATMSHQNSDENVAVDVVDIKSRYYSVILLLTVSLCFLVMLPLLVLLMSTLYLRQTALLLKLLLLKDEAVNHKNQLVSVDRQD